MILKLYVTPNVEIQIIKECDVICRASKDVIVDAGDWDSYGESFSDYGGKDNESKDKEKCYHNACAFSCM